MAFASAQERTDPAQEERRRVEREFADELLQPELEPGPIKGEPPRRAGDRRIVTDGRYEEPAPFALLAGVGPQDDGTLLETLNIEQAIAHLKLELAK